MPNDFYAALKARRSIYSISNEQIVSQDKIQEVIGEAVKHTPSSFNSQSARVVLLFEKEHEKLWDMIKEALRKIVPAKAFAPTEEKINSFKNGYGTVLFFEDERVVTDLQGQFPLYKDNFPLWSHHSSGMLQFVIWTGLEAEGLGASLQHYGSLIEQQVIQEWKVPETWKLIAQLPFGKPTGKPGEKEYKPLEERIKIFK